MPSYRFSAINQEGKTRRGTIRAPSQAEALQLITGRNEIPTFLKELPRVHYTNWSAVLADFSTVPIWEIILFTKQMSTMIRAGVPMLTLLEIIEGQSEHPKLKTIVKTIHDDVQSGSSLHDAFRKHPKTFSPLYCSMIQAGERSGTLPEVLNRLIYVIDHEQKIKSEVRSALQYPIITLTVLGLAFAGLLTFIMPKFVAIFKQVKLELPWPTQVCIALSVLLTQYWLYLILSLGFVVFMGARYFRTDSGRLHRDRFLIKMPLIGKLIIKSSLARFASIFAILQASGVMALESLKILTGILGNAAISRELDHISQLLEEGRGISGPLRSARYFTPLLVNMVRIGEECGRLEEMLRETAAHYDIETEYSIKRLTTALGPILTILTGVLVGFFALSIYLPMWDLSKMTK